VVCHRSALPGGNLCFSCTHAPAPIPPPERSWVTTEEIKEDPVLPGKTSVWPRLLWLAGAVIMVIGFVQTNMETVILGNLTALWGAVYSKR